MAAQVGECNAQGRALFSKQLLCQMRLRNALMWSALARDRGVQTEVSMQERFQYAKAYPDAYKAMLALTQAVEKAGLAPQLVDLMIIASRNSMAVHLVWICIRRI